MTAETFETEIMRDGAKIAYRLWRAAHNPDRRLVVLLHGMASNLTRWSEFVEHTTLKERFDILRIDLRGHGDSFYRGPIGMRYWCDDLRAVLAVRGYTKAVLAGHSLGAQVAANFAARFPEQTASVVLIDPIFNQTLRGQSLWLRRLKPLLWLLIKLVRLLNFLGLRRSVIPNRDLRALDEHTRATLLQNGRQEEMIARYSSPWADIKNFATANYLQEFLEVTDPLPALDQIGKPFLILLSKGVTFTDPEVAHKLLASWPNVAVEHLDAYHWPLTEKPVQVRQEIEKWCERT
jgi:pimeloyl-ACP methyl ester carboxylesterase